MAPAGVDGGGAVPGYGTVLTPEDAAALGVADLDADASVGLGPASLIQDAGAALPVVTQSVRRGYVSVRLRLPSGQLAELRVPDKIDAAVVGVRINRDAVALVADA